MNKRKSSRNKGSGASPGLGPVLPDRRLMEKQMAEITRLLNSREFASIEEANEFLQQVLSTGKVPETTPSTPLEQAQELVYQALETSGGRRVQLARRALEISSDCADAYVVLAEAARDVAEAKGLYEQGVKAGERALGPETFKHDVGHFWGIIETRPYMRARQGLAEVQWILGERQQAIEHLTEMLRLNPNDNQGLRYILANWLLVEHQDEALGRLLKQYPDEYSANWAYTRALYTFREEGAGRKAKAALQQALKVNPFVPLYLSGVKKMPRRLPEYVGMGDENEAIAYVAESAESWLTTPGAVEWFVRVLVELAPPDQGRRPRSNQP